MDESTMMLIIIVSVSVIIGVVLIVVASALIYFYFFRRRRGGDVIKHYREPSIGDTSSNWSSPSSVSKLNRYNDRGKRHQVTEINTKHRQEQIQNGHFTFPVTKIHHNRRWRQRQMEHRAATGKYKARKVGMDEIRKSGVFGQQRGHVTKGRSLKIRFSRLRPRGHAQTVDRASVGGPSGTVVTIGAGSESIVAPPSSRLSNAAMPPVLSSGGQYNTMPILQSQITSHTGHRSTGQSELSDQASRISGPLLTANDASTASENVTSDRNGSVLWNP